MDDGADVVLYTRFGNNNQRWHMKQDLSLSTPMWFRILNVHSGKLLAVEDSSLSENARISQYSSGNGDIELWSITQTDTMCIITNKLSRLQITAESLTLRAHLTQKLRTSDINQRWVFEKINQSGPIDI
jgi:hypothetical protein